MQHAFQKRSHFKEDAEIISPVFGTMRAAKRRLNKEMGMDLIISKSKQKALQRNINKMIQNKDPKILNLPMFSLDPQLFEKIYKAT